MKQNKNGVTQHQSRHGILPCQREYQTSNNSRKTSNPPNQPNSTAACAPVRELPHAGRPGADAGEIEHGETGKGLRGAWEGHSENSGTGAVSIVVFPIPYRQPILQITTLRVKWTKDNYSAVVTLSCGAACLKVTVRVDHGHDRIVFGRLGSFCQIRPS
jgi:hypothetical protein